MADSSSAQHSELTRRTLIAGSCLAGLDAAMAQSAPVPAAPRLVPTVPVAPMPARKYPPRGYMFLDEVIGPPLLYKIETNVSDALLNGVTSIVLVVSSSGGAIDAAVGIHNILASVAAQITSYNLSAVSSAANVVFQAASKRIAHPNAHFVFHPIANSSTITGMTNATTQELSESMQESRRQVEEVLKARTRIDAAQLDEMFRRQVIVGAKQALSLGIIDEIAALKFPLGQVMIPTI